MPKQLVDGRLVDVPAGKNKAAGGVVVAGMRLKPGTVVSSSKPLVRKGYATLGTGAWRVRCPRCGHDGARVSTQAGKWECLSSSCDWVGKEPDIG